MSGRAGRRGIDDRGIVILIVDEKMGPDVGKELLKVLLYRTRHININLSEQLEFMQRLSQVEEQNFEVKKVNFLVNSSPEAIVYFVQKALFTYL